MKKQKNKILIIEASDIIQRGLSALLVAKNNTRLQIDWCSNEGDISQAILRANPKILIASPEIFEQNEKLISPLKEKYQLLLVGLIYAFHHPDQLKKFDGLVFINDPADKIQSTINELLQSQAEAETAAPSELLTARETEILKLLVSGNTTKQIATTLHISTHTVNAHRKNIMRKLDIKTVSGLTIYAVLNNIITLKEA